MNGGITEMSASEFQIIQDALAVVSATLRGRREADEHALAALEVLEQRLERVRALGGGFSKIGFSTEATELRRNMSLAAVG
jgi:hypothetical protein